MLDPHVIVGPMTCQRCRRLVWYVRWFDMIYRQGLRDAEGVHRCIILPSDRPCNLQVPGPIASIWR